MTRACLLLLLLAACTPSPQALPPQQQRAVQAALAGWAAAGLPAPDKERCDFARTIVRVEPLETGCPGPAPVSSQLHDGCLDWEESGNWFRARKYPVVVIDPTYPASGWDELIIHELVHSFVVCSGMNPMDPGNRFHTDKRLFTRAWPGWQDNGVSAEGRALALLSGD